MKFYTKPGSTLLMTVLATLGAGCLQAQTFYPAPADEPAESWFE